MSIVYDDHRGHVYRPIHLLLLSYLEVLQNSFQMINVSADILTINFLLQYSPPCMRGKPD